MTQRWLTLLLSLLILFIVSQPIQAQQDTAEVTQQLLDLTNQARAEAGLSPLVLSDALVAAAQAHAQAMANNDFYDHTDPVTNTAPADRATAAGYRWQTVAENIAAGYESAAEVIQSWLDSPEHRANMLSPAVTEVGFGYVFDANDTFPDPESPYQTYWVQLLAAPAPAQVEPTPTEATIQPVATAVPTDLPTQTESEFVTLNIEAEPDIVSVGEAVTIRITISGDSENCGQSVVTKPVDVILVIDNSGSMRGTPLQQAKQAAQAFVRQMDLNNDRIGVVQFDSVAHLTHPLDTDQTAVIQAIEGIPLGGGTAIHAGLQTAFNELHSNARSDTTQVIVLLSDGESNRTAAERAASTAKAAGIKIISVGLGSRLDETLLRNISTPDSDGNPQYFNSPDGSDLESIYIAIAQSIREYGLASNLTLQQRLGFYQFAVFPESINEGGTTTGDAVTWQKELLEDGDTVFTYQVRPRESGTFDLTQATEATFLECEQIETTLQLGPGPQVVVQAEIGDIPVVPFECEWWQTFPWWLLAPLLLLLLLLLTLLFPWGRRFWRKLLQKPLICKILALLTFLYMLILVALFARALIGDLCQADYIYFWRATADKSGAAIFETRFGAEEASPVDHLNEGSNCVACHASSSNDLAKEQYLSAVRDNQNGPLMVNTVAGRPVFIPLINASYAAFSPDGQYMAVSIEDRDIYILELATGQLTALEGASNPDIIETMPAWSDDGETIAFVRTAETNPLNSAEITAPSDIYTVPRTGGTPLPLIGASGDGFNYYPAYSPDGKWLAFTRHVDGTSSYSDDAADIYIVPAEGGERIFLRSNSDMADSWPSWSPDSRWLGFGSNRFNDQFDILLVQINEVGQSSGVFRLPAAGTPDEDEFYPVWQQPLSLTWWDRLWPLWPWLLPLLLLLGLGWLFCRERRYELSGQVTDAITRQPIPGAKVKIGPYTLPEQHSDGNGRYAFQVTAGTAALTVTAPEYSGQTRSTDVQDDTTLDFRLYPLVEPQKGLDPPPPLPEWVQPPVWQPTPALIIGLGGTGRYTLTYLKKNLLDAGAGDISKKVRLLLLDSSDYELLDGEEVPVTFAGVELSADEVVELGEDLSSLIQTGAQVDQEIRDWFPAADYRTRLGGAELDLSLGTYQRRPPARAALVRDVKQGEESQLWQVLLREANKARDRDDNRLRVVIVGSLAGGFGSAIASDIAYLARRAGQEVGAAGTSVEAYLATNGVFSRIASRPDIHAANTYAALRELERFQLAQGYPFRMIYNHETAGDELLAGLIDWRLLEEVYLFDKPPDVQPANEVQLEAYDDPAAGIFPAMADAITLWLDKASRSGSLGTYRRSVQGSVTSEQRSQARAVAGGLGVFAYRLPMYDLMVQFRARWVRALLRQLIMGYADGDLRLDPRLNRELDANAIQDHVHRFLVGLAGYEDPPCPATIALLGILANEGNSPNFREKLADMPSSQLTVEVDSFQNYLAGSLAVILNGVTGSRTAVARGGKIGYALYFLNTLEQELNRASEEADLLPPDAGDGQDNAVAQLRQLLPRIRQVVVEMGRHLQQQAGQLSQQLRSSDEDNGPGLYEQCAQIEQAYAGYLAEMEKILTRHYVHPEDLLAKWQATYLVDSPAQEEALQRVHWHAEDGKLHLALQSWGELVTILKPGQEEQEYFLQALFQLAAYVTQDIWEKETLATVLAKTALHSQEIEQTISSLHAGSTPLLNYDEFTAPNAMWHVVLGVNKTVSQVGALEAALRSQMTAQRQLSRLGITDPYSLLVAQTVDVLPVNAIPSIKAAEQLYRSWYGLLPNVPADQRAEPTAVFRAERIALMLEQQLQPELQQASRLLRPIIVTALDAGGVARFYALAVAAGWVTYAADQVTLRLPDGTSITIAIASDESGHPLVRGFVHFAAKANTRDIQGLQTAIATADESIVSAWRQWTRSDWQMLSQVAELRSSGPDGVDLATVITLVARDAVRRHQQTK